VKRLAPQTRIAAGAMLFVAGLAAPALSLPGVILVAAVTAVWIALCGPPGRTVRAFFGLGLAMFLPYVLLAPLLFKGRAAPPPAGWIGALAVPWDILLHGLAGLLVATATLSTLSAGEMRSGLLALPVPRLVTGILVQIVQQTASLLAETKRVAAAMAVRGASGGVRALLRALASFPRVWLPRLVVRAERLAAAMELRGYAEADLRLFGRSKAGPADAAAAALALCVLALAAALRLGVL
jgi:energy-coupling factor transporter transmembrane protein EcfT